MQARGSRHGVLVVLSAGLVFAGVSTTAGAEEPAEAVRKRGKPVHLSLGSGVFLPWDGNRGFDVSSAVHVGLGSDRFWVGGELEYRRFEAELKQDYRPDMQSFVLRFSFQYHPFPRAWVSPYLGFSVGFLLSKVDDNHSRVDPNDKLRGDVGAGSTMLGLAGIEVSLFQMPLHVFAEGRLENASDIWKRNGGNFQMDQVGGLTGLGGLRMRF